MLLVFRLILYFVSSDAQKQEQQQTLNISDNITDNVVYVDGVWMPFPNW